MADKIVKTNIADEIAKIDQKNMHLEQLAEIEDLKIEHAEQRITRYLKVTIRDAVNKHEAEIVGKKCEHDCVFGRFRNLNMTAQKRGLYYDVENNIINSITPELVEAFLMARLNNKNNLL